MNSKIYIVKYTKGNYEYSEVNTIFATTKKSVATKYATRYNKMLKKWKEHYRQYETDNHFKSNKEH